MKKTIVTLLMLAMVVALSFVPAMAASDNNLAENGHMEEMDFENQGPYPFYMWSEDSTLGFGVAMGGEIVNDVSHSGDYCVKITSKSAPKYTVFYQPKDMGGDMVKDQTYVLTAWVKTSLTTSTTGVRLFVQYMSGGLASTVIAGQYQVDGAIKATTDWKQIQFEFKPMDAPGWVDSISIFVFGIQINAAGDVWIDDLTMTKKGDAIPDYSGMPKQSASSAAVSSAEVSSAVASSADPVSAEQSSAPAESVQESASAVSGGSVASAQDETSTDSSISSEAADGPKSDNTVAIIVITIVLVIAACGVAYYFIFRKK
jgi:hypothetical protein